MILAAFSSCFLPAAATPAPATLLKPIEKDDFSYFFLLFPPAATAAAPAAATRLKRIEKMIVATFSSCFLLLLLCYSGGRLRRLKSNHSQQQIPMAVKDGKASKLRPKTA